MTMPQLDASERDALRRVEDALREHPYLRVDLAATGPAACTLEDVMSARLGLLHTEGAKRTSDATLRQKLARWEADIRQEVVDEGDPAETLLRYDTYALLHSEPWAAWDQNAEAVRRDQATTRWEQHRRAAPSTDVWRRRLRQNREFCRHGAMLPFYWVRRRRIRRMVPDRALRCAPVRETFFAIEQIGPLVDNFAFAGAAGVPTSTRVGLADLAFLYMQLADEFLDELATAGGGHTVAGRIVRKEYHADTSERPLRSLSIESVSKAGVDVEGHVTKFGISLAALFSILEDLADAIDRRAAEETPATRHAAHRFLHHCFQTYLDEVELCEQATAGRVDQLALRATAWHFYRKNNMVMMLWLDLRARLLGLDPATHTTAIRRWGYLLAAFQIFDDLKDLAFDIGKQPSYPLQVAATEFPSELAWIETRFGARRAPLTRDDIPEVNLNASKTVRRCMQWSRLVALAHFDNTLLYAWDQRWRKSWMRRHRSFNPIGAATAKIRTHVVDRLIRALLATREAEGGAVSDEQLAFALDTAAYEGSWQIYLALFPNIRAMYRFATLQMWMTAEEKANAARRLLRRYPHARTTVLLDLAEADVDHEVPRDRLEAFAELIEV